MRIRYIEKNISAERMKIIDKANEIIKDFSRQGFTPTLRQLYYQFVSKALIDNTQQSYKRLGDIISDGRLCGHISWESIKDNLRTLNAYPYHTEPAEALRDAALSYKIDYWDAQHFRPEVWIEKDALGEIAEHAADKYRVPLMVCRGYMSQSAIWDSAFNRFQEYIDRGQVPVVIHLGDHDPSGIDMTRDIADRLDLFCDEPVKVVRIALNMDQIEQYRPPPNPAKVTDSRAKEYIKTHGRKSWELDALQPKVLTELIRNEINVLIDDDAWEESYAKEEDHKATIRKAAKGLE